MSGIQKGSTNDSMIKKMKAGPEYLRRKFVIAQKVSFIECSLHTRGGKTSKASFNKICAEQKNYISRFTTGEGQASNDWSSTPRPANCPKGVQYI
jgi:hypothetical protein